MWDLRNNECIQTITEFKRSEMKPTSLLVSTNVLLVSTPPVLGLMLARIRSCQLTLMLLQVDRARHRMVSFGQRQQVFKINPHILFNTIEDTHRSPVVAVLYNRIFGNVVTVAEDSECSIWRPATGEQIFTFFDTERNDETHLTCANFDEAGRRLLTGDHQGVIRVSFSTSLLLQKIKELLQWS